MPTINKFNLKMAKYFSITETSEYLKISVNYLYKLTSKRKIPFYNPTGGRLLFKVDELDKWVEQTRCTPLNELSKKGGKA